MEGVWMEQPDGEIPAPTEASFPSVTGCKETPLQGEHMVHVAGPRDAARSSSCRAHEPHINQLYQLLHAGIPSDHVAELAWSGILQLVADCPDL